MKPTTNDSNPLIPLNKGNSLLSLTRVQQEQLYDWLELIEPNPTPLPL